jgi:hypothetical protein
MLRIASVSAALVLMLLPAISQSADNASISGAVKFTGTAPKEVPIKFGADPVCEQQHSNPQPKEEVIVNPNGTLKNVIVYVKSGLPANKNYPLPKNAPTLDQKGCMYQPHVFAMRAGQELKITNSDPTLHNIHALAKNNRPFNSAMINNKVPPLIKKFDKPEMPMKIKCEVHPWMSAYVGVFDHPFYAVTGDDGSFKISGLPAGEYTVAAWHEKLGELTQKIQVKDGGNSDAAFAFDGSVQPSK